MGWGRAAGAEIMPRLSVGYTEHSDSDSKLKKGKGFLEPNIEPLPNYSGYSGRVVNGRSCFTTENFPSVRNSPSIKSLACW